MSTPTTAVAICNLALDRLGQNPVASIDPPTTPTEVVCARHYDQTRRALLRKFLFNFSKKFAVWTADSTEVPAFGFTTAYRLPSDFIRLLALGDITVLSGDTPGLLYELSNGFLYCDSGDATAGGANVAYTFDAQDVTRFDPLFISVMYLQMAKDMAFKFTLKQSLVESIDRELQNELLAAAAAAGQEKPPRRVQRSRLRDVRRAGGIFRDNTRI